MVASCESCERMLDWSGGQVDEESSKGVHDRSLALLVSQRMDASNTAKGGLRLLRLGRATASDVDAVICTAMPRAGLERGRR